MVPYPGEAVGWALVSWTLLSGLLDGQDWVLYSVVDGTVNVSLPGQSSRQSSRRGSGACMAHVWGTKIRHACGMNSLVR